MPTYSLSILAAFFLINLSLGCNKNKRNKPIKSLLFQKICILVKALVGIFYGLLAQRLEQRTHNPLVVGSNPTGPTRMILHLYSYILQRDYV